MTSQDQWKFVVLTAVKTANGNVSFHVSEFFIGAISLIESSFNEKFSQ